MSEDDGKKGKLVNQNWVLKCKRRNTPFGVVAESGREKSLNSSKSVEAGSGTLSKQKLNSEVALGQSTVKKKGDDGYYYECVVCDLGGNLLCCDNCPRTYHIQCLDPPLKRVPVGEWHCPKCCKSDSPEAIKHSESITKRARTRITIRKPKPIDELSGFNNVLPIFGGSIPGKKRSSNREKLSSVYSRQDGDNKLDSPSNDVSCLAKPSRLSRGGSAMCSTSDERIDDERKEETLQDSITGKKSMSRSKEVRSISAESKMKGKASEAKPDLFCKTKHMIERLSPEVQSSTPKTKKRKPISPSKDVLSVSSESKMKKNTSEMKIDPCCDTESVIGSLSPETNESTPIVKKRKHKSDTSMEKKCNAKKGKCAARADNIESAENSKTLDTHKLRKKDSKIPAKVSMFVSGDDSMEITDFQLDDEMVPVEATHPSHELDAAERINSEPLILPVELQEVDRVLGCRVQGEKVTTKRKALEIDADDALEELLVREGQSTVSKEDLGDVPFDGLPEVNVSHDVHCSTSDLLTEKQMDGDSRKDRLLVYRRSGSRESKCGSGMDSMNRGNDLPAPSASNAKNEDDSIKTGEDATRKVAGELSMTLEQQCHSYVPKEFEIPGPDDAAPHMPGPDDTAPDKNRKDLPSAESASSVKAPVSYEFLVKWVGKSHLRNSWIPESELKLLAKRKLDYYKHKFGIATITYCEEQWELPQRVIATRSSKDGITEVLVKWTGLPYDECTWERVDDAVIKKSSHLVDLFNRFESQALVYDINKDDISIRKDQIEIVSLTEQPKELKGGVLYPHQLEALNWLRRCWQKSKNVILADEMGLGKTISASAYMSSLYSEFNVRLPSLVLVPLSTMPNWTTELAMWAPDVNVVEYHGSAKARAIIRQYEWHANDANGLKKKSASFKFNVLLTTYEMVLTDCSFLRSIPWEVLVVDEGHRLKNKDSKLFSLLNTFSFQHRVLLTGTPLQNNIGELHNLLNFLQPALFPSLSSFEEKFNDLTTSEKVEELKKLVAPHMLRRLKKDAQLHIPPKTERMVPVELSSIQAECYRAMLTKNYDLLRNIGKGAGPKSLMNIVMELRKVCNHPYLIPGTEPDSGSLQFLHEMRIKASAKLTVLHSMLKLLYKEGHRVLIFSQMTKLLDILEDYVAVEFGPKAFERVDGSVSVAERQAAIARFNQDESRFVFLLSTRACGLGINLATADTVILYDSDFNPHVDLQAMNRAHRIGQSNTLLVFRFFVRASVEERILQLAKKKLMLEQIFEDKSELPKKVNDILRWGTDQLFSNSPSTTDKDALENLSSKEETGAEAEQKHRRRTGSLGDVYADKCTESSSKIVWDDNAILKLLDRTISSSGSADDAESETDNMLGSVKSVEWYDDQAEEQAGTALLPPSASDTSAENFETNEGNSSAAEENEWDRLLRVRWETYQTEATADLGRGKRQRKTVAYKEEYAVHSTESLTKAGLDVEPEAEREQQREYSPAGRALKAKYAKLRARQKERLAKRELNETCLPLEHLSSDDTHAQASSQVHGSLQCAEMKVSAIGDQNNKVAQSSEGIKDKADASLKVDKMLKHKPSNHMERSDFSHINHNLQPEHGQCMPNNLPPVLGLYAPNADPAESTHGNALRTQNRQIREMPGNNLPSLAITASSGISSNGSLFAISGTDKSLGRPPVDDSQRHFKSSIPSDRLPFKVPHQPIRRSDSINQYEKCVGSSPELPENMALPKLPFGETLLPRYKYPGKNMPPMNLESFPSLSLGSRAQDNNYPPPIMPFVPNFEYAGRDASTSNHREQERLSTLGLGQMSNSFTSFPENHKRVLENIMMRTGTGTNNLFRKKSKTDIWSEDELDNLWIGVRRHGRGNWDAMLQDRRLTFSKHRTSEDLSVRWEEEQQKILEGGPHSTAANPPNPRQPLFSGISDGLMARALHGSKFNGVQKFQTHLTDMKLGIGNLGSSLQHSDPPGQFAYLSNPMPHLPTWNTDRFQSFPGDIGAGPSDRSLPSSMLMEFPSLSTSLGMGTSSSLGLSPSSYSELQFKDNSMRARVGKLPSLLDRSLNLLRDGNHNVGQAEFSGSALLSSYKGQSSSHIKGHHEAAGASSSQNQLPHWLREAVSAPPRLPEANLPPALSAIAQSVRVLYGSENSKIPPFVVPGPPPSPPKDPRKRLRKKKKLRARGLVSQDFTGTSSDLRSNLSGDNIISSSVSGKLLFSPFRNLEDKNMEILTSCCLQEKLALTDINPSREMLQLGTSCGEKSVDKELQEQPSLVAEQQAERCPSVGSLDQLKLENKQKVENGDSVPNDSGLVVSGQPQDVGEDMSSEGTLSDGCPESESRTEA